jgi:16S rRNA (cytosine967-C5)-methyltransferase
MSPRQHVIKLLDSWENSDAYADVLLENLFEQNNIPVKDRALIQEIFFGVVRWRKRINWILKQLFQGSFEKSPRFVRFILQSSLYQLIYLDRIPAYAVINEAVRIAKRKGGRYWAGKINAILRNYQKLQNSINFPDIYKTPVKAISILYSHPEWLVERWIKRWGRDETIALCTANNRRPSITLRVNRLKIIPDLLIEKLSGFGCEVIKSKYNENFLYTYSLPNLSQFEPFQHGLFTIQDESAGMACQILGAKRGETIVDLCAAPGGKTSYLTELGKNKALVYSVDKHISRLKFIRDNLNRLGFSHSRIIVADGRYFFCKAVDKVLVDAPCSGLGVLSKRVDLRWRRKPEQLNELAKLQSELLKNAASIVKTGGVLVYSTCTIEPQENEEIVIQFLKDNKQFRIDPLKKIISKTFLSNEKFVCTYPHKNGMDGSFAVRLLKVGE